MDTRGINDMKIIKVKTNIKRVHDICKYHPWLKRLGAYIKVKDYDVLGNKSQYGIYKHMPVETKIPTSKRIFLKYNPAEGGYYILQLN
jgi:hypothetical protein